MSRVRVSGGTAKATTTAGPRYARRNAVLKEMGFSSYKAYLASDLWKKVRRAVLDARNACVVCGKRANEVHHTNYTLANLTGETIDDMEPICRDCHETIEFGDRRRKRTLNQANQKLGILTGAIDEPIPEVRSDPGRGECCRCGKPIARSQVYCWHCSKIAYGGKKRKSSEPYRPTQPPVKTKRAESVWRG